MEKVDEKFILISYLVKLNDFSLAKVLYNSCLDIQLYIKKYLH